MRMRATGRAAGVNGKEEGEGAQHGRIVNGGAAGRGRSRRRITANRMVSAKSKKIF